MKLFEVVPAVLGFTEQPEPLTIRMSHRPRASRYTPDLRVDWKDGKSWLVEIKPHEEAMTTFWQGKFRAAAIAATARGFHFVVITERHLDAAGMGDIEQALTMKHRHYVEGLGDPAQTPPEFDFKGIERRVLDVLADALDNAPSSGALELLGVVRPSGRRSLWWATVTEQGHVRRRRMMMKSTLVEEVA